MSGPQYAPEMDKCREHLKRFCGTNVLEIGHGGGRPIVDWALCVDRAVGSDHRANCGTWPTHLTWDATEGLPFADNTFCSVVQSHFLEDALDTRAMLVEMVRVTKHGGYVVNFLPDEQTYRAHCKKTGQSYNAAHKHDCMGLDYMRKIGAQIPGLQVVDATWPFPGCPYSFSIVFLKL